MAEVGENIVCFKCNKRTLIVTKKKDERLYWLVAIMEKVRGTRAKST